MDTDQHRWRLVGKRKINVALIVGFGLLPIVLVILLVIGVWQGWFLGDDWLEDF